MAPRYQSAGGVYGLLAAHLCLSALGVYASLAAREKPQGLGLVKLAECRGVVNLGQVNIVRPQACLLVTQSCRPFSDVRFIQSSRLAGNQDGRPNLYCAGLRPETFYHVF